MLSSSPQLQSCSRLQQHGAQTDAPCRALSIGRSVPASRCLQLRSRRTCGGGAELASGRQPPLCAMPAAQPLSAPQASATEQAAGLAIDMRGVSVTVGPPGQRKQVLRDCYFAVQPGQLHMLLGSNGCGKSTLLRCAGGLLPPDEGSVATAEPAGFVFQNPDHQVVLPTAAADVAFGLGSEEYQAVSGGQKHLWLQLQGAATSGKSAVVGNRSPSQRVALPGAAADVVAGLGRMVTDWICRGNLRRPELQQIDHQVVPAPPAADVDVQLGRYDLPESDVQAVVDRCLEVVGLLGIQQRPSHTLSGGERQRLAVAGALAQAPAVLLLDELTSFLDEKDQRSVLEAVRAAVDAGGVTAVWVTHRLDELEWADAASYMEDGRIAVSGPVDRVRRHLAGLGAPV